MNFAEAKYISKEGEVYLKNKVGDVKRFWLSLEGNELYCYSIKKRKDHYFMHCLTGIFINKSTTPKQSRNVNG